MNIKIAILKDENFTIIGNFFIKVMKIIINIIKIDVGWVITKFVTYITRFPIHTKEQTKVFLASSSNYISAFDDRRSSPKSNVYNTRCKFNTDKVGIIFVQDFGDAAPLKNPSLKTSNYEFEWAIETKR